MAYQSLYRRYRSGRFDELVGQSHVVTALKNAITEDRVGHAYLFSGPRGTGKTSTARILAKALNCTNLGDDGEPCGKCESCVAFDSGTSYDLQELDAASNNGVEAIRELISRVALGTPGRTKVYILDEVHMLSSGAENALLKTLEEPPDHVVFVLATTEPHKVVATIRSRTQHHEFELIPAADLERHVRFIVDDAQLDATEPMIEYALRVGGGSARDTLSALDRVLAAGGVPRTVDAVDEVLSGLADSESATVISGVARAFEVGLEPRVIGEQLLERLRDAFLATMGAPLGHLSEAQAEAAATTGAAMGPAAITRSLETIGAALVEMRQAPDPRIDLEVALLRLTKPELDTDLSAIVARLERLEQGGASIQPAPVSSEPSATSAEAPKPTSDGNDDVRAKRSDGDSDGMRPADAARAALARADGSDPDGPSVAEPASPEPAPAPDGHSSREAKQTLGATRGARGSKGSGTSAQEPAEPAPEDSNDPSDAVPETDEPAPGASGGAATALTLAAVNDKWDSVRASLPGRAKSRYSGGRFIAVEGNKITFGLPNAIHRDRCQECAVDVTAALGETFGVNVQLDLVVDDDAPVPAARAGQGQQTKVDEKDRTELDEQHEVDLEGLTDADSASVGGVDLLSEVFPGAEVLEPGPGS
ncbi:MAG: DNA polymerase III subunit gamma/tau [Acidimicrobiales bacterium]